MFHNYFFLKRLAASLQEKLVGLRLLACFSQNKDELMLGFGSPNHEYWIRANLDPNVALLQFPPTFHRAAKNSIDLFSEAMDQEVTAVKVFAYERSFQITLTDAYTLIFKMHGRRSNVLLVKQGKVIDVFRKVLKQDFEIRPEELAKNVTLTEEAFQAAHYHPSSLIPALGQVFQTYWDATHSTLSDNERWQALQRALDALEQSPIYLIDDGHPRISLVATGETSTSDSIAAANWLYEQTVRTYYLESEKSKLIGQLKQKIKQSENYIFKTQEKLRVVENQRSPEELANIIMANLGLIQMGLNKVTLSDIYRGGLIEIKLNPKLSPQNNAENYYRKSKNRHQEVKKLRENIAHKTQQVAALHQQVQDVSAINDHKALKQYQKGAKPDRKQKENVSKSYHEVVVDGWIMLIGKNAKANDELTLKVAKKDDLWLHAKDVSGSHVIVKQVAGQNYPQYIIETAAAYAAYYSKRKTETLCPVIYTPKKFVRKVKGAPFGQVVVQKEQIVMVAPVAPSFSL